MAMVVLKGPIRTINGKQGGNIWRHDQRGQHIQKFPRLVAKDAQGQRRRRSAFSKLLKHYIPKWYSANFVRYWTVYASNHPKTNREGEKYVLAWHTMFLSYNINKVVAGQEPDRWPPWEG